MKVIYDEAKAIKSYQEYTNEQNVRFWSILVSAVLGFIGVWLFASVASGTWSAPDWAGVIGIGLMVGAILLILGLHASFPTQPPDVTYYLLAKENKVLGLERGKSTDAVYLITENNEHVVEATKLCEVKKQFRTDFTEPTFDVHSGIIYVPYSSVTE